MYPRVPCRLLTQQLRLVGKKLCERDYFPAALPHHGLDHGRSLAQHMQRFALVGQVLEMLVGIEMRVNLPHVGVVASAREREGLGISDPEGFLKAKTRRSRRSHVSYRVDIHVAADDGQRGHERVTAGLPISKPRTPRTVDCASGPKTNPICGEQACSRSAVTCEDFRCPVSSGGAGGELTCRRGMERDQDGD